MFGFLDAALICLIVGPIITMIVSLFKRLAIVAAYPKIVAAVISVIFGAVSTLTTGGLDWMVLAECTIVPFAASVATYEVVKSASSDSPKML